MILAKTNHTTAKFPYKKSCALTGFWDFYTSYNMMLDVKFCFSINTITR